MFSANVLISVFLEEFFLFSEPRSQTTCNYCMNEYSRILLTVVAGFLESDHFDFDFLISSAASVGNAIDILSTAVV